MVSRVDRGLDLEKEGEAEKGDNGIEIAGKSLMYKIEKHKKWSK